MHTKNKKGEFLPILSIVVKLKKEVTFIAMKLAFTHLYNPSLVLHTIFLQKRAQTKPFFNLNLLIVYSYPHIT